MQVVVGNDMVQYNKQMQTADKEVIMKKRK